MAFDCYCAVCGIGFSGMKIGSPSDATSERRQQYVERLSQSLDDARVTDETCQNDEDIIHTYDPRLVDQESIAWTREVHCLGVHDVKGETKAFISGPGYYADAGELAVKMGERAKRTYFNCYGFGTDDAPGPVVPFHWSCFEILLRTLTGTTDPKNVNLDVLYDAMMSQCNTSGSALRLAYGDDVARAQGQYWRCLPGAEYSVKHPTSTPDLEDFMKTQLQTNTKLRTPSKELNLGNRQSKNPFGTLPTEIVHQICSYLPGESLTALDEASLFVHQVTCDNYFWRCFIESSMPWLWESQVLRVVARECPSDLNYKQVYLWLNNITAPRFAMEHPTLMGVANRRRIWGVCEELSISYKP
ncbi:hypothetical protein BJY04DRAFT_187338 [Aspergillus karnatakaensis]|uniref:uncharacterized protein n=1 Tax=Aspergillus karnatakaensis TaxID=1810916 RepID=UPI003CCD3626